MTRGLVSRSAWLKLQPFQQGYVFYMQSAWPASELAGVSNPHALGTPAWDAFRCAEFQAMLSVQDSEE